MHLLMIAKTCNQALNYGTMPTATAHIMYQFTPHNYCFERTAP